MVLLTIVEHSFLHTQLPLVGRSPPMMDWAVPSHWWFLSHCLQLHFCWCKTRSNFTWVTEWENGSGWKGSPSVIWSSLSVPCLSCTRQSTELDTALEMCLTRVNRGAGSSWPAGNSLPNAPQDTTDLLGPRAHCWLIHSLLSSRSLSTELFSSRWYPSLYCTGAGPYIYFCRISDSSSLPISLPCQGHSEELHSPLGYCPLLQAWESLHPSHLWTS